MISMIDKETVKRVSKVARLELSDEETEKFSEDLGSILSAFKSLNEVNTDGIEPSFHPFEIKNVFREDKVEPSLKQEDALKNAEQKEGKLFKGPRAV